jgi:hypothetical protein
MQYDKGNPIKNKFNDFTSSNVKKEHTPTCITIFVPFEQTTKQ